MVGSRAENQSINCINQFMSCSWVHKHLLSDSFQSLIIMMIENWNICFSTYVRSLCTNCRMSVFLSALYWDVLRAIFPLKLTAWILSFQWPFARWNPHQLHLINEEARSLIYHRLSSAIGFMPGPDKEDYRKLSAIMSARLLMTLEAENFFFRPDSVEVFY